MRQERSAPTARQLQIVSLVYSGLTNEEIGRELTLSQSTVKKQLEIIKLDLQIVASHSRVVLALKYRDWLEGIDVSGWTSRSIMFGIKNSQSR